MTQAEGPDTIAAQDARWAAWKTKGAAQDVATGKQMRIVFVLFLLLAAGVLIYLQ